jgi:hypothetical protein
MVKREENRQHYQRFAVKEMTAIRVVDYSSVDFVWISDHYDIHLAGLCKDNGELKRFETDFETTDVYLFPLTLKEKIRWKARQKLFELCVGKHWTYPNRRTGLDVVLQYPRWLSEFLFRLYYRRKIGKIV